VAGELAPVSFARRLRQNARAVFPAELRFRHPWRAYQGRILADFDRHLADGRFHVVAAPGSGKTVLGLEVVRRIGKPALVCAPTLALRSQWIERLCHQFLAGARPAWVSEEIDAPALLTFATYQALHARARRGGVKALARTLRAAGVGTLVFDEAHHLKQEWWRTLDALSRALRGASVVALTATPPYDVAQAEWNRYSALAGMVDAEISAAELVLAGDLCPHQDYVYLQRPTRRELARVVLFEQQVASFLGELGVERELAQALREHPALVEPAGHIDALLDDAEYALALAIFLRHAEGTVPAPFLAALGLERDALPPLDAWWAERLLQGVLFADARSFAAHEPLLQGVRARLQQMGALERHRVHLLSSPRNERALRASPAKLRAVADIVEAESRSLGEGLRLLVLTERIREHEPGANDGAPDGARRVGVVPLFDHLRRLRIPHVRLCAASGRVGVVPREIAAELSEALASAASGAPSVVPLPEAPEFSRVALSGEGVAVFVRVVTRAFQEGRLTAIVGTTALLGEGWDAPALNTLVLATTIGSYVSTNQSRGRALRRSPEDPLKTANIWHPVCVDPRRLEQDEGEWALLRRRFGTFMGPGLETATVESGLARLGLDGRLCAETVDAVNAGMFRHAEDREQMAELWRRALVPRGKGAARPVRETRLPRRSVARVSIPFLPAQGRLAGWLDRWLLRRRIGAVAHAVREGLLAAGVTGPAQGRVRLHVTFGEGKLAIQVVGMEPREELILHQALQEVFCPLHSPRYLLAGRRRAYPVPKVLGENRERADCLLHSWQRRVGGARLIATRTPEGKRLLLRTVQRYLADHCRERAETGTRWVSG
jgi:superfamily II DNA or RNA helicase